MADRTLNSDDPFNEAVATTGLFLIVTSIIAVAVAVASWGMSETWIAVLAGAVAVVGFASSIMCFVTQAADPAPVEVSA